MTKGKPSNRAGKVCWPCFKHRNMVSELVFVTLPRDSHIYSCPLCGEWYSRYRVEGSYLFSMEMVKDRVAMEALHEGIE